MVANPHKQRSEGAQGNHFPVLDGPWPLSMKLGVGFALSFLVTILSYYLLERPFLKLKEGFKATTTQCPDKNMTAENIEEPMAASVFQVRKPLSVTQVLDDPSKTYV